MEAIVLAGGFGTRLQHVVSDVPKPMAPVCNKPFLQYILDNLINQGVNHIVLAVGYKWETIAEYFGESYRGVKIDYSVERDPLFTGGAIKQALTGCTEDKVFVLNGDTYFDVELSRVAEFADARDADIVLVGKRMVNFDRYGTLKVDELGKVEAFVEKQYCEEGVINGGIYYLNRDFLESEPETKFSFEEKTLRETVSGGRMYMCMSDGYFIDIGIPEDYHRANSEMAVFHVE